MNVVATSSSKWRLAVAHRGPRLLYFDVTPYMLSGEAIVFDIG